MDSDVYLDTVGSAAPVRWSAAYIENSAIERPCPRCGAQAYEVCVNPTTGRNSKAPCIIRNRAN